MEILTRRRTIAIVANGVLDESFIPEIGKSSFIIGVDRAAYWLIRHGIVPNLAVGDFDSTSKREIAQIEKQCKMMKYQPEKDWTDLELAVKHAVTLKMSHIIIYGAIGRRFDHTLAAVGLLAIIGKSGKYGIIRDRNNEITLVSRRTLIPKNRKFPYVSIIPASDRAAVTLTGFKYNADRLIIREGDTVGVSNEIPGRAAVVIPHRGSVILIRSRD